MLVADVMTMICMMTVSDNNADDDCYDGDADDDCYEGDADDDCYDGDADDGEDLHRKALSFHGYQWH